MHEASAQNLTAHASLKGGVAKWRAEPGRTEQNMAMQSIVNKVKSTALGVADSLTPVLKVNMHVL